MKAKLEWEVKRRGSFESRKTEMMPLAAMWRGAEGIIAEAKCPVVGTRCLAALSI
jgi:hypothetical protein